MNQLNVARTAVWVVLGGCLATSLGAVPLTACGESASCTRLRNDTYATKQVWDACDPADPEPCIEVFGNPKDCTGVLFCDFAVNPKYRAQAEQAVLTIGEQSQGCYLCAVPNCVGGEITTCDPATRRCIVVTAILEGGATFSGEADSGAAPTSSVPDTGAAPTSSPDM